MTIAENIMITVVVTVYNRARYIRQCIESVLGQDYEGMEILCVDDASTDGSYEILQAYAARDSRIRLMRNERNHGVQRSRNRAIEEARGLFITFIDDDDWIGQGFIKTCVDDLLAHPDIQTLSVSEKRVRPDGTMYVPSHHSPFGSIDGSTAFLKTMPWQISGCYVTYTSLQRQYPFDESCRAFGDENTGRRIYLHSNGVRQSDALYFYRMHQESVSHSVNMGQFTRLEAQQQLALQEYPTMPLPLKKAYETFRWKYVINAYMYYFLYKQYLEPPQRKEALSIIRTTRHTIDFSLISKALRWKFGYCPLLRLWPLFRLQETLYFSLRKLIRRLRIDEDGDPRK